MCIYIYIYTHNSNISQEAPSLQCQYHKIRTCFAEHMIHRNRFASITRFKGFAFQCQYHNARCTRGTRFATLIHRAWRKVAWRPCMSSTLTMNMMKNMRQSAQKSDTMEPGVGIHITTQMYQHEHVRMCMYIHMCIYIHIYIYIYRRGHNRFLCQDSP